MNSGILGFLKTANLEVVKLAKNQYINGEIKKEEALKILSDFRTQVNLPTVVTKGGVSPEEKKDYDDLASEITKAIDETVELIETQSNRIYAMVNESKQHDLSRINFVRERYVGHHIDRHKTIEILEKFKEEMTLPLEKTLFPTMAREEYDKAVVEISKAIDETTEFVKKN